MEKNAKLKLYKDFLKKNKSLQGYSINGMMAACIYYSSRENSSKNPLTFQEILNEAYSNEKEIKKCDKKLREVLKLPSVFTNATSLIPKNIAKLNLGNDVEKLSQKLIKTYEKKYYISGKNPKGICAAALYCACKMLKINRIQVEIAACVGVTGTTLRTRYREMLKTIG